LSDLVGTIGNMTAHGKTLSPGPGAPNIFVNGKSVWRVGLDFHSCPIADPKPHGGGMVLIGRKRTLAGNFQIAFEGDLIFEATSVNVILL
jgi:uncharacterized Zn-binding protein involved in type VI secretion